MMLAFGVGPVLIISPSFGVPFNQSFTACVTSIAKNPGYNPPTIASTPFDVVFTGLPTLGAAVAVDSVHGEVASFTVILPVPPTVSTYTKRTALPTCAAVVPEGKVEVSNCSRAWAPRGPPTVKLVAVPCATAVESTYVSPRNVNC
jgi:hypothetical protein